MLSRIDKITINRATTTFSLTLREQHRVLLVGQTNEMLTLWVLQSREMPEENVNFVLHRSGEAIYARGLLHAGSFQDGKNAWHLFKESRG